VLDILSKHSTNNLPLKILQHFLSFRSNEVIAKSIFSIDQRKVIGYSYLSLYFGNNLLLNNLYLEGKHDPCIKVAAYTHKEELIEEETTFYYPVVASPDQFCDYLLHGTSAAATHTSLHWGSTWNMHTPLENLESGENSFDDACMSSV